MGSEVERLLRDTLSTNPQKPQQRSMVDRVLEQNDESAQLRSSIRQSNPAGADRAAQALRLQDRTQLPMELIERNYDEIVKEATKADFDPDKFRQNSPIVATWLAERPEHASIASEDMSRLSYLERQVRYIKDQFSAGRAVTELRDIGEAAMFGVATPQQRARQKELQKQLGRMQDHDYGITGFFEGVPGAVANQLPIMGRTLMSGLRGATVGALAGGAAAAVAGQAGPQAALPEEVLTVPGAAGAGAGMGWRMGSILEAGQMEASLAYLEFEDFRDADGRPIDRNVALGAATVVGIVNGLLENLGFQKMMSTVPGLQQLTSSEMKKALASRTTARALMRYLRNIGEASVTEGFTEYLQEITKNSMGIISDPNSVTLSPSALLDRMFAGSIESLRMGAQAGGGFTMAMSTPQVREDLKQVRRAERAAEFFTQLGADAQDSKLLERSPEKMQEVVARLTADGPVEDVYLPVTYFQEVVSKKGLDPAEVAEAILGDRVNYDEAAATHGDLKIPTAVYAAKVAKTEFHGAFVNELRLGPMELSAREAQEKLKALDEAEAAKPTAQEEQADVEAEEITTRIKNQLLASKPELYDEQSAQLAAEVLYGNVFKNLSKYSGLGTPKEIFERYGMSVQLGTQDPTSSEGVTMAQERMSVEEEMVSALRVPTDIEKQYMAWHEQAMDERNSEEIRNLAFLRARKLEPHARQAKATREARIEQTGRMVREQRVLFQEERKALETGVSLPPGFHSRAERLIETKMPNRASIEDIRNILKDIKADERKWIEVDRILKGLEMYKEVGPPTDMPAHLDAYQGAFSGNLVNKEFILNWLRANRLQIVEERKPDGSEILDEDEAADVVSNNAHEAMRTDIRRVVRKWLNDQNRFEWRRDHPHGDEKYQLFRNLGREHDATFEPETDTTNRWVYELPIRAFLQGLARQAGLDYSTWEHGNFVEEGEVADWRMFERDASFTPYSAPGGGDTEIDKSFATQQAAADDLMDQLFEFVGQVDEIVSFYVGAAEAEMADEPAEDMGLDYRAWTLAGGYNYRIIAFRLPKLHHGAVANYATFMLPSSHRGVSEETNVFFHVRTKDRELYRDTGVERVLFIEEIQSDWHQKGRKYGYHKVPWQMDTTGWTAKLEHLLHVASPRTVWIVSDAKGEEVGQIRANHADNEADAIRVEASRHKPMSVPDAPFQNTWHEFALKRLIRLAAEEGYDSIGWTTGKQQSDRYRLSEHVSRIKWRLQSQEEAAIETPVYSIQAWTPHQGPLDRRPLPPAIDRNLDEGDLFDALGKELTSKIRASLEAGETEGMFEGPDLELGGHGMEGFYDGMLPNFAKQFGKKFGASMAVETYPMLAKGETPETGESHIESTTEGYMVAGFPDDGPFVTRQAAINFAKEAYDEGMEFKAHYFKLTPELKKAALDNEFTLYQMRKAEKGYLWEGAMAELETLETNDLTMKFQELVDKREGAEAYTVLKSLPGDMQASMMRELPITFNWIMQSQTLNQEPVEARLAYLKWHAKHGLNVWSRSMSGIRPTEEDKDMAEVKLINLKEKLVTHMQKYPSISPSFIPDDETLLAWMNHNERDLSLLYLGRAHGNFQVAVQLLNEEAEIASILGELNTKGPFTGSDALRVPAKVVGRMMYLADESIPENKDARLPNRFRYTIYFSELIEAYHQQEAELFKLAQGEKKGRIRIGARSIKIDLLEAADLSTFIHETGHFYLEVLADLSTEKNADPQLIKDYETIKKWLGATGELTREHHEMFARGFEKYLGEGRAPVRELRRAFGRFKAWLFSVYADLKELDVELNDDVRQVFDRLIAGHEELASATGQQFAPLDLSGLKLPAAELERYQNALEAARLSGEEELTSKIMREFEREKSRLWQAERAKVREKVAQEANDDPVLRARALLQYGTLPDDSPLPENFEAFKLSRVAIHAQWPAEIEAGLPKGLTAGKNSLHPNIAADLLGFDSGDALLAALVSSQNPRAWIEQTTNERMRSRRYRGTPLKTSELPLEAMKAVHNEQRAQLLQLELKFLAATNLPALKGLVRRVARRVAPTRAVREEAERIIANKELRDVNPLRYQRAEAKASKEALEALLRGDVELAFDAKQREQLAQELYRAATRAQDRVEKIVNHMQRFNEKRVRERIAKAGSDYLAQIDGIRERFDFVKRVTLKDLDKRRDLKEFVEEHELDALAPAIPDKLLKEAYRKHFKELTLDELDAIYEGVKVIEKLSRLKNRLLASARVRTIRQAVDEMVTGILEHHEIKDEPVDYAPGMAKRVKEAARGVSAAHQKPENIAEWLDGNKNLGPVWSHLFKPIADAEAAENRMRREKVIQLKQLFAIYPKHERATWFWRKTDFGSGLGSLTKANILTIALNWGNQYNREALMEGNKLSEAQITRVLDTLDARDWQLVQGVWDFIESFWPEIAALEKDLNGIAPKKVEATPIQTKYGVMRGGYYPIVFDSQLSLVQAAIEIRENVMALFGRPFARAMTRHGHTKERTDTGGKPIKLTLSGLTTHVTNVMHDLTHRRAVIDVSRLIRHPDFQKAVNGTIGKHFYKQLHPWLVNVAAGERAEFFNPIEGIMGRARTGATVVNMGWKLTTAMVQFLSFTNTIKELGPKYSAYGVSDVYAKPWAFAETWRFVTSRSEFMKHRIENFDRDVNDALKNLNVAGVDAGPLSVIGAYGRPLRDSFFMFIGLMDMGVSLPTWLGAYRRAMEGAVPELTKGDETMAIDYADKIVRQTQGVGGAKDLAAIQRGPNTLKNFTMFYSYFSVLFGQFAKSTHQVKFDKNIPRFAASMLLLWFLPAALEDLLRGNAPDDDDDPTDEDWFRWLARTEARYPFQTVAVLRDVINGMDKFGYEPSAAFDMFDNISKASLAGLEAMPIIGKEDDEFTRAELKASVMAIGYITQLPTRQLWLTSEYLHDWLTGEEEPANAIEAAWRAAVSGKPREDR